ncbi:MAG: complex I subunit 1 family protein, partial [Planctomycetota bacterium]
MFLAETTEPHGLEYLFNALKVLVIFGIMMQFVPALIWLERKMAAWIQLRDGPTKTGIPNLKIFGPLAGFGLWGLIQPVADAIKLILKEDFIPRRASKILFAIAPALVFLPIALALVVVPIGYGFEYALEDGSSFFIRYQIADFGVGILFALAALSIGVHGLALGGWASNNKYGQFGGVRASAQLISYEAAMFMVVLAMIMTYGSLSLQDMVIAQTDGNIGSLFSWGVFRQPLAFIIFFVCMYAESNRLPFDFPEAEAELIGGYH